jgi:hypothetical protein
MRLERGQRLYDVQTLLGYETRAYVDHVLAENISFRVVSFPHCGLISGAWLRGFDLSRFDAWLDECHVAGDRNRRAQGGDSADRENQSAVVLIHRGRSPFD